MGPLEKLSHSETVDLMLPLHQKLPIVTTTFSCRSLSRTDNQALVFQRSLVSLKDTSGISSIYSYSLPCFGRDSVVLKKIHLLTNIGQLHDQPADAHRWVRHDGQQAVNWSEVHDSYGLLFSHRFYFVKRAKVYYIPKEADCNISTKQKITTSTKRLA